MPLGEHGKPGKSLSGSNLIFYPLFVYNRVKKIFDNSYHNNVIDNYIFGL